MLSKRLDTWLRDQALLVDVLYAFALVAVIGLVALATQGPMALALTTALPLAAVDVRPGGGRSGATLGLYRDLLRALVFRSYAAAAAQARA